MCDSARQLFYQIRTSNIEKYSLTNINDCIQVFRAIFKKNFNSSIIKIIEDKNEYMDFIIDEENFLK
jgi:hypothetical protein